MSDEILDEYTTSWGRPKSGPRTLRVTDETVREAFDLLDRLARTVSNVPAFSRCPRTGNDGIATGHRRLHPPGWVGKDLLDLMQDVSFRAQYPRLTILNPVALLQTLTPPPQQQP